MRDFASVAEQHRAAGRLARADLTTLVRYYVPLVQEYIDAGRRIDAELVERVIVIFHERRGELSIGKLRRDTAAERAVIDTQRPAHPRSGGCGESAGLLPPRASDDWACRVGTACRAGIYSANCADP